MARILGIDYGSVRVGFAISDPDRIIATAHEVIRCETLKEATHAVKNMIASLKPEEVVVGLPINMDGSMGPATEAVMKFVEALKKEIELPISTWDERLSTKSAHDVLIEAGTRRNKRKHLVDKVAAQIILQNYLDAHEV